MAIGAILGAVSTIAGIGTSLFGASEQAKAQEAQARAEAKALRKQAQIQRKMYVEVRKPAYKRDIKATEEILKQQRLASFQQYKEQRARRRQFEYKQEFAGQELARNQSQAVGRSLAMMAASGAGASSEAAFGNLGQIWSSAMQARLDLNLDTNTGRDIYKAQLRQGIHLTKANQLQGEMSLNQLKDQAKLDKLQTQYYTAGVANTGPAQAAQMRAAGISNIGQSLTTLGSNQSAQRFTNQIFGQPTPV